MAILGAPGGNFLGKKTTAALEFSPYKKRLKFGALFDTRDINQALLRGPQKGPFLGVPRGRRYLGVSGGYILAMRENVFV